MNKRQNPSCSEDKTQVPSEESRVEARRKFLKTAGKFALYTPPTLTLLMHPSVHAISKSNNGVGNGPDNPPSGFNHVPESRRFVFDNDEDNVRTLGDQGPGNPGNRGGFK
ncbi:hypothetical protein [Nitrosococcus wardiae]|uniref:Uncharacterized protein n=1 Tax=Nitrosococcus wardiae TaxID=1814290 RepID=A0A4V1AW77_9GAMM|nr:hypothetical protein [Nitrosococcus wardiae]QBQ55675.1 hypothetical protein E3U44_15010 [Nitrosococcus wardiae]